MLRSINYKYAILTGLVVLATINLTKTSIQIMHTSKKIEHIDTEIALLEEEKATLEKSIEHKKTEAYIEEKARNELNLVKPKEEIFIVPGFSDKQNHVGGDPEAKVLGVTARRPGLTMAERKANIGLWLELFF